MKSHRAQEIKSTRKGATSVEFALSAPLLFAIVFALIEISRLFQLSGAMTTASILGAREASILTSESPDVENEVRKTLSKIGVNEMQIAVSPTNLTSLVKNVSVRVDIPLNNANGFFFTAFVKDRTLSREFSVDR